jgi:hypothetical protein
LTPANLTPDTAITRPGYLSSGTTPSIAGKRRHGTLHLRDAIKKSCDVLL